MQNKDRSALDKTKFVLMRNVSPLCRYNADEMYLFKSTNNIASSERKIKAV